MLVDYPLTINNAAELATWWPNAGDAEATDEVILGADIDLKGVSLTSVENFLGIFNGNGKSIKNWESSTPLFTKMGGTVKNLTLDSSCIFSMIYDGDSEEGVHYCAPLASISSGSVIGCTGRGNAFNKRCRIRSHGRRSCRSADRRHHRELLERRQGHPDPCRCKECDQCDRGPDR